MSLLPERIVPLRDTLLEKISAYGQKAGELGRETRELVFGFRQRSTILTDRHTFSVKLMHDHRLVQRKRVFQQSGGTHSSMARYALDKARHQKQF